MPVPIVHIFETGDYVAQVRRGRELLAAGQLVVLPTETVYGAAGLLTHPEGRRRLADLRAAGAGASADEPKPFTVHVARPEDARRFLGDAGDLGERLIRKLWPGPVALAFDVPAERRAAVAAELKLSESDLYDGPTITLRCPDHIVAADVIDGAGGPVALSVAGATSSGPSGSAQGLQSMAQELEGKVELIFDAGPTKYSRPSTMLRVRDGRYEIVRQGVYDERIIERLLRTTILFVCSGNTCRSPMSEAIARNVLAKKLGVGETELEKKGINVVSAGSYAMPGARATPQAVEALRGMGMDLSTHRSRPLSVELIHQADRIFTMSRGHAGMVTALVPSAVDKVATLDPTGDIEDPIGGDTALYVNLAGHLQELIEQRLQEIK